MQRNTISGSILVAGLFTLISLFAGGVRFPAEGNVLPPLWLQLALNFVGFFITFAVLNVMFHWFKKHKKALAILIVSIFVVLIAAGAISRFSPAGIERRIQHAVTNGTAVVITDARSMTEHTKEEIEADVGLKALWDQMDTLNQEVECPGSAGMVYTAKVISDGFAVVYRICPYVTFNVRDVGTAGSCGIQTQLNVLESVVVNGELNETWDNYIQLRNIVCSVVPGENTALRTHPDVIGKIAGTESGADKHIQRFEQENDAMLVEWKSNACLRDTSEYLWVGSNIATKDSTEPANVKTYATSEWTFDIYCGAHEPLWTTVNVETIGEYTTNVK